jgi:hypothetical protein
VGADIGVTKRITLLADLVGQRFFEAPQVSIPTNVSAQVDNVFRPFSTILMENGSYSVNNLGVGVKANVWKRLLVSGNVSIKLDDGGVRATVVPLVGISYTF